MRLFGFVPSLLLLLTACTSTPESKFGPYPEVLLQRGNFVFAGGFSLPEEQLGESSVNWSEGVIEVQGNSLYMVGNEQEDAIAEFLLPELNRGHVDSWVNSAVPVQPFVRVFPRLQSNTDNLDQIVGMEWYRGLLVVNAVEYYDAPADNNQTTVTIESAARIDGSAISGPYSMQGSARAAGWLSAVPAEWQRWLGCTHISGASSGGPIIGRYSVGPSAYCVSLRQLADNPRKKNIQATELLGFDESYPLNTDLFNKSLDNTIWTHLSRATYGFIVPGTATYVTFGYSGGHHSGVGYKLARGNSDTCDGYCPVDPADTANYYWLWHVRDLLRVASGRRAASEIHPYEWGEWKLPVELTGLPRIGAAAYNESDKTIYMTVLDTRVDTNKGTNPPVVIAYRIDGLE